MRHQEISCVWNPHKEEGLIKYLNRVRMRAIKLASGLKKKCYKERLMELKLPTLQYRRIRGDMTEVHKLLTNQCHDNAVQLFDTRTRGHIKKLVERRCRYSVGKYSFCIRSTMTINI